MLPRFADREKLQAGSFMLEDDYSTWVRPKVGSLLKLLKLDQVYESASGDFLHYRNEAGQSVAVLDLLGGYGSTLLGHHPPELVAELRSALSEKIPVHAQLSIRKEATLLAAKLNELVLASRSEAALPAVHSAYLCTLANSGTEAVEASLKHALMQWNARRENLKLWAQRQKIRRDIPELTAAIQELNRAKPVLLALEGSFHGKTAASVAATWNQTFRSMYPDSAVEVVFLKRDSTAEEARKALAAFEVPIPRASERFSRVCGVIYEPIQCEGGIHRVSQELLLSLRESTRVYSIPLIADEIQTGLWRTGSFLASHATGVDPDYILLGKSLGGGLCKVGAVLVPAGMYQEEFGLVHTSTFAEDDLSSRIARKTLELAGRQSPSLAESAANFERAVMARIIEIQKRYPRVIRDVRGHGFLLGIQFDFSMSSAAPEFLCAVNEAAFASYLIASYLLNGHRIRVGVTLSQPDTIRVEPGSRIAPVEVSRFCDALETLCRLISEHKLLALTEHFWRCELGREALEFASPARRPVSKDPGLPVVAFLSHVIDVEHLCQVEPMFRLIPEAERKRFIDKFGPVSRAICYHEQRIEGSNGKAVHARFLGSFASSEFFEKSLRRDTKGFEKVEELFSLAKESSAKHVGLGQFTSIVSENGVLLRNVVGETPTRITTGNSLTAGFAYQALLRALENRGAKLSDVRVGIVGATGNICNVLAQLIGDHVAALTLVHREPLQESQKFRDAIQTIVTHSELGPSQIRATHDPAFLADCDAIVVGTNSTQKIIRPEFLKKGAIVLDLSVPSNVDPRVLEERPDVECFQGGLAALPLGQKIETPWVPTPSGETFACIAETLTTSLLEVGEDFSLGGISKERVLQSIGMAKKVGIELGSLRANSTLVTATVPC